MDDEMKISDLIAKLTEVMNDYGDIPVKLVKENDLDDDSKWRSITNVTPEPRHMHYECVICEGEW